MIIMTSLWKAPKCYFSGVAKRADQRDLATDGELGHPQEITLNSLNSQGGKRLQLQCSCCWNFLLLSLLSCPLLFPVGSLIVIFVAAFHR